VLHQGYTQSDHELQVLAEQGRDYLAKYFDQRGALFWIKLNYNDGEYMLGLGRRTSPPSDNPRIDTTDKVWVRWCARVSSNHNWGTTGVAFKPYIMGYAGRSNPVYCTTYEKVSSFVPIVVALSAGCTEDNPRISKRGFQAVQHYVRNFEAGRHVPRPARTARVAPARHQKRKQSAESASATESESVTEEDEGDTEESEMEVSESETDEHGEGDADEEDDLRGPLGASRRMLRTLHLGCSIGTGTGTGGPVPGSPDPVVNNARWRPLGSQGENKTRQNIIFTAIYIQVYTRMRLQNQATGTAHARLPSGGHGPSRCHLRTLLIAPQAALAAVWRWPNPIGSRPGHVGQSVCGAKTKIITGRHRPVPGTGTGAGHSDPVDPVTR
jgi:hypothetical protein